MEKLQEIFGIQENDVVSIVGAGGKTSLLFFLGKSFEKSLLTTTTKIFRPLTEEVYINQLPDVIQGSLVVAKSQKEDKLYGFTPEELDPFTKNFRYTFIEADGSRMLPLKGWSDSEPVVPPYSNKTIGVLDIRALGLRTATNVFRLDEFSKITDANDVITMDNMVDVVLDSNGLFKGSNYNILYVNKVENSADQECVKQLLESLRNDPRFSLIDRIIVGSIHNETFKLVQQKNAFFVLASGLSRRMGTDKLSMEYKGLKVIEHVMRLLSSYPQNKYLIVKDNTYKMECEKYHFMPLINNDYEEGQGASIRCATQIDSDNYMYFLADMPNITKRTVDEMLESQGDIVITRSGKVTSAPLCISSKFKEDLSNAKGDVGAKQVVKNHREDILYLDVDDREQFDIDELSDLER